MLGGKSKKKTLRICLFFFFFLMLKSFARHFTWLAIASFYVYGLDLITMPFLTKEQLFGQHVHVLGSGSILGTFSYRL